MAKSLKPVNGSLYFATQPVEQKGFNAAAIVDTTAEHATELLMDSTSLTPGTKLLTAANRFFGEGSSSVWVGGVADSLGLVDLIEELIAKDIYWFTFIIDAANQATYVPIIANTITANTALAILEVVGTNSEMETLITGTNSDRVGFIVRNTGGTAFTGDAAAALGLICKEIPGTITLANKALNLAQVSGYSNSEDQSILDANGIIIRKESGLVITRTSNVSSGDYIETISSGDYIKARVEENVLFSIVNEKVIEFTDIGINVIYQAINSVMSQMVADRVCDKYTIEVPKAASVPTNDKANKVLNNVKVIATLVGSIHTVNIPITVKL